MRLILEYVAIAIIGIVVSFTLYTNATDTAFRLFGVCLLFVFYQAVKIYQLNQRIGDLENERSNSD